MEAVGERHQSAGREGLQEAKLWLESTTRFKVPWTSWGKGGTLQYVTVPQLRGHSESFDLAGQHLEPDLTARAEFYAEVKRYTTQGDQRDQYRKYLTRCYSATLAWHEQGSPRTPEFIWITWHPFGATDDYMKLTQPESIKEACDRYPQRIAESDYDGDIADDLSGRLWFLLASPRLEDMRMSRELLGIVHAHTMGDGEEIL